MNYGHLNPQALPMFVYNERDFKVGEEVRLFVLQGPEDRRRLQVVEGAITYTPSANSLDLPKSIGLDVYRSGRIVKSGSEAKLSLKPSQRTINVPFDKIGAVEKLSLN